MQRAFLLFGIFRRVFCLKIIPDSKLRQRESLAAGMWLGLFTDQSSRPATAPFGRGGIINRQKRNAKGRYAHPE